MSLRFLLTAAAFALLSIPGRAAEPSEFRTAMQVIIDESEGMSTVSSGQTLFRHVVEDSRAVVDAHGALPATALLSWRTAGGSDAPDDQACEETRQRAPSAVSASPVLQALAREKPRGPRPLAAALEASVADLPRDGRQHGLLIVTSGVDSCGRDVCASAEELRTSTGLGAVTVLFLGSDAQAAGRLACLGTVTRIKDPSELKSRIGEALEALDHPAEISVSATQDGHDVPATVELFAGDDAQPALISRTAQSVSVMPGMYQIHVVPKGGVEGGSSTPHEGWRRNVEMVAGGQLSVRVPIGSEPARITTSVKFNGAPAPLGTRVSILYVGDTENPLVSGAPGETLEVPAGKYDVRASIPGGPLDAIQVWKPEVRLQVGQSVDVDLVAVQKRGILQVDLLSGGQPLQGSEVVLVPAGSTPDSDARFAPGRPITLPAGTYKVVGRLDTPAGRVQADRADIVVAPELPVTVQIEMPLLGRLAVEVAGRHPEDGIAVSVFRVGEDTPVGTVEGFSESVVPVGSYDLRADDPHNQKNPTYWLHNIKVTAGKKTSAIFRPK